MADNDRKVIATNRRARRDFQILDRIECGIVLTGSEVKSLRASQIELKDAYAEIRDGEMWLVNAHIAPYKFATVGGHEPERRRKLLAHKREIVRLGVKVNEQGLTLVPLSVYFTRGIAKVEIGVARGRRAYDKRQAIRERETKREMERAQRRGR